MIKIGMKNEAILEVDATGFREEENVIWFDRGGVNVMVVNKSEFSYCFIVDEDSLSKHEQDLSDQKQRLIKLEREYSKRINSVHLDLLNDMKYVEDDDNLLPTTFTKKYREGYIRGLGGAIATVENAFRDKV